AKRAKRAKEAKSVFCPFCPFCFPLSSLQKSSHREISIHARFKRGSLLLFIEIEFESLFALGRFACADDLQSSAVFHQLPLLAGRDRYFFPVVIAGYG